MKSISHTMPTVPHGFTLIGLLFQPWTSSETFGLALLLAFATVSFASAQSTDVLTYHNDNARTGEQLHEEILTPANVNAAHFGKLRVARCRSWITLRLQTLSLKTRSIRTWAPAARSCCRKCWMRKISRATSSSERVRTAASICWTPRTWENFTPRQTPFFSK